VRLAVQHKAPPAGRRSRGSFPRAGGRLARAAALALAALAASCASDRDERASARFEVERSYQSGSAQLTQRISDREITAADRVLMVLEAAAGETTDVSWPEFGEKLGKFRVREARSEPPRLAEEGRLLTRRVVELEPFLPGDYEIPSLTVRVDEQQEQDQGEDAAAVQTIETEPVAIEVRSVLPPPEEEPQMKEIAPPVEMPGLSRWWYAGGAAAIALLALAAFVWWRRRRRPVAAEKPLPPHERAYQELERLLAEDLLSRGEAKLFYLRLSGILRRYIEGRFGLHAPESTTEEFLAGLRASSEFDGPRKSLLKDFLEHCDLVKFAAYQPSREEIDRTIESCRRFIDETRLAPEPDVPERTAPDAARVK